MNSNFAFNMQVFRREANANVVVVNGRRPPNTDARALFENINDPENSAALFKFCRGDAKAFEPAMEPYPMPDAGRSCNEDK